MRKEKRRTFQNKRNNNKKKNKQAENISKQLFKFNPIYHNYFLDLHEIPTSNCYLSDIQIFCFKKFIKKKTTIYLKDRSNVMSKQ